MYHLTGDLHMNLKTRLSEQLSSQVWSHLGIKLWGQIREEVVLTQVQEDL